MDRILKKSKEAKRIRNVYAIAIALLIASSILGLVNNNRLEKQIGWVKETHMIINNLEKILSTLKDAEIGVRSYLLTSNIAFLEPYNGSYIIIDSLCNNTKSFFKNNAIELQRFDTIQKNIAARYDIFRNSLSAFVNNNRQITDSIANYSLPLSKNITDNIRKTVLAIEAEESDVLTLRNEKLKSTLNNLNIITFVSILFAIGLIVFGFFAYLKENAERKKAIQKIRDYQLELTNKIERLNYAKAELIKMKGLEKFAATGRIARTIAHEVRNPLTNINLAAEQIKAELLPNNENVNELIEMINRNSNRINQLISDLLQSTKFSELNYQKISINTLLDEALEEANDRIVLHKIKVQKKYNSDICEVSIDKDKLRIAILNIILNAIEAMENIEHGELTLETKEEDDRCKIIISDNGAGMDEETLSRVFEAYFTSKQKGNGLGLTNTQNIIYNHKGDLSVKSEVGKGTTFIITLNFAQ